MAIVEYRCVVLALDKRNKYVGCDQLFNKIRLGRTELDLYFSRIDKL